MNRFHYHLVCRAMALLACLWWVSAVAHAQVPTSYGDYYSQHVSSYGVTAGRPSPNRYLYDKYFYHRPTVSPYINLDRPDPAGGTSYQRFVRPEVARREASARSTSAYIQQRKQEGRVGAERYGSRGLGGPTPGRAAPPVKRTPSSYYNQWYGGWNNR